MIRDQPLARPSFQWMDVQRVDAITRTSRLSFCPDLSHIDVCEASPRLFGQIHTPLSHPHTPVIKPCQHPPTSPPPNHLLPPPPPPTLIATPSTPPALPPPAQSVSLPLLSRTSLLDIPPPQAQAEEAINLIKWAHTGRGRWSDRGL